MLASAPLYDSSNFWAGATATASVAAILVSIILWQRGAPRRLLVYSLLSATALLSERARLRAGPELEVSLDGRALGDPHVVSVRIKNRSRRDIRGADFENGRPLMLDLGAPILKLLGSDSGGEAMPDIEIETHGSFVKVGPGLIKGGQLIRVDLLTDGHVWLNCSRPALVDVTVKLENPGFTQLPGWIRLPATLGFSITLVMFAYEDVVQHRVIPSGAFPWPSNLITGIGLLLLCPLVFSAIWRPPG